MSADLIDLKHAHWSAQLLQLNNDHAQELSWLSAERLKQLVHEAFLAVAVGEADALLLAFDQDAKYDSPNFLWFRERYPRFVYVDRVVVGPTQRGRGLARSLYQTLFARAAAARQSQVVCEINSHPPNPASDAFHRQLGFVRVGEALLAERGKQVRYFLRPIAPE